MKLKRIIAYIFDIFLVSIISSLAFSLFTSSEKLNEYEDLYNESAEVLFNVGSGEVSEDTLIDLTYRMQLATKSSQIINIGLLIIYFGVFGYLKKGQTLGKKIMNIKVAPVGNKKELNPSLYMLRSVLVTNLIPKLIALIALLVCSKNTWYEITNITSNISSLLLFIMVGFMIFRDDERGLHDLICQTKVISTKEETKVE